MNQLNKFKVGDTVIRIKRNSHDGLIKIGEICVIKDTAPGFSDQIIMLKNIPGMYFAQYFQLYNELEFEMVPELNTLP